MSQWVRDLRGALLFDTATFERFSRPVDSMWRGMLMIVIVSLIASLPAFVLDLGRALNPRAAEVEMAQASSEFENGLQQMTPFLQNIPPQVLSQIRQGFETGMEVAARIDALPTILPRPLGGALQALGHWLQRPFATGLIPLSVAGLAAWLGYGIWVMLVAKLLGGRAELHSFFGSTGLYAAPHLLNVFAPVPVFGLLAGIIAFFWGGAIYVKATAVSHDMNVGRALLAVILPALAAIVVIGLALLIFVIVIASLASGAPR